MTRAADAVVLVGFNDRHEIVESRGRSLSPKMRATELFRQALSAHAKERGPGSSRTSPCRRSTVGSTLATYSPFIRDYFGIPGDRAVLLGIPFGYPEPDHPANSYRTNRAPLEQVVHWVSD